MSIEEQAILARQSSNLRHSRAEIVTATDRLQALALCGDAIMIEVEGAAGEAGGRIVREFMDAITGKIKRINREGFRARGVALQITRELLLSKCLVCQGRGVIPASADGENEREHACMACGGTGKNAQDNDMRAMMAGADRYSAALDAVFEEVTDWAIRSRARALWELRRLLKK